MLTKDGHEIPLDNKTHTLYYPDGEEVKGIPRDYGAERGPQLTRYHDFVGGPFICDLYHLSPRNPNGQT